MANHEMDDNKRLGIAWAAPATMLVGGLIATAMVPATSSPPEAVAVASANDELDAKLSSALGDEEKMDPEVEKILYPYREKKEEAADESVEAIAKTAIEPAAERATEVAAEPVTEPDSDLFEPPPAEAPAEPAVTASVMDAPGTFVSDPPPADGPELVSSVDDGGGGNDVSNVVAADTPDTPSVGDLAASDPQETVFDLTTEPDATVPPAPGIPDDQPAISEEPIVELAADPPAADPPTEISEPPVESVSVTEIPDPAPAAPPVTADPEIAEPPTESVVDTEAVDPAPAAPPASVASVDAEDPEPVAAATIESDGPSVLPAVAEVASAPATSSSKPGKKPFLGVGIRNPDGAIVTTLYAGSTAKALGVMIGDTVIAINGVPTSNMSAVRQALSGLKIGDATTLQIQRGTESYTLGPLPLGSK